MASAVQEMDAITTHVLDQTTGRPAGDIRVELTFHAIAGTDFQTTTWHATTSKEEGRIRTWTPTDHTAWTTGVRGFLSYIRMNTENGAPPLVFSLRFDTLTHWGFGNTFYPDVNIRFIVDLSEKKWHWHVPLLLGPYGYTTYRGT